MENLFTSVQAGLDAADIAWTIRCREEDLRFREWEVERTRVADSRRKVDEKAEQLKSIAHLSALIGGFSTVMLVEISIPNDVAQPIIIAYGFCSSAVVALMLMAMINCTFMLVGVLKYDCLKREVPFDDFWLKRCEDDWRRSFKAFTLGIPIFLVNLGLLGWITFRNYLAAAVVVSVVAVVTVLIWTLHTEKKWAGYLTASSVHFAKGLPRADAYEATHSPRHAHDLKLSPRRGLPGPSSNGPGVMEGETLS